MNFSGDQKQGVSVWRRSRHRIRRNDSIGSPAIDFIGITPVAKVLYVLAGRGDLPAASAKDAISLVRGMPGKLTYGSWGTGSLGQIGMELIVGLEGLKMLHVPFNGGPPAYNALAGSQIDLMILPYANAAPLAKGGKLKIYGITSPERLQAVEGVPTLKEQGINVDVFNPVGFFAPAKTPPAVVQKLHTEINEVLKRPDVQATLRAQGMEPFTLSQAEYTPPFCEMNLRVGARSFAEPT